jgi:DNA invertase Pin-like site-specific DNA recombinase
MPTMIYGYARVSTDGQSVEGQVVELTAAGTSRVFSETASGARSDRAQLKRAVAALMDGDVLLVTRLDRLARSTRDLLNVLAAVAERGAAFRSLRDAWADTTTPHGRLMLTVLGGLAEFERELIAARTSEGRARARERGVKLGPKHKLTPGQRAWVAAERARGESTRHLARVLSVSKATIARIPPSG